MTSKSSFWWGGHSSQATTRPCHRNELRDDLQLCLLGGAVYVAGYNSDDVNHGRPARPSSSLPKSTGDGVM